MPRKMFAVHETAFLCIDAFWRLQTLKGKFIEFFFLLCQLGVLLSRPATGAMSVLRMVQWHIPVPVILTVLLLAHNSGVPDLQDCFWAQCLNLKKSSLVFHLQDRDFLEIYSGEARVTSCLRKDGFVFWIVSFQYFWNQKC